LKRACTFRRHPLGGKGGVHVFRTILDWVKTTEKGKTGERGGGGDRKKGGLREKEKKERSPKKKSNESLITTWKNSVYGASER